MGIRTITHVLNISTETIFLCYASEIIPNMLDILDQLPDSYLEIATDNHPCSGLWVIGFGPLFIYFFRACAIAKNEHYDRECTIVCNLTAVKTKIRSISVTISNILGIITMISKL
jgi:hypothetical protein